MEIIKAKFEDLPQILELQKLSYLSEAEIHNNYSIQPLIQTLDELEIEFKKNTILKLLDNKNNEIIGSIRAYEENNRVYIGKLIVNPDYQNRGFGTNLLKTIETIFPNKIYELFTSSKSEKNLYLYKKYGYKEFKRQKTPDNIEIIFLEKIVEKV